MNKSGRLIIGGVFFSFSHWSVAQPATSEHHHQKSPTIGKTKASHRSSMAPPKKKSLSPHQNPWHTQFNLNSNYVFRGISQTNNDPAAQGGASYTFGKEGLYVGAWGSNATFVDELKHKAFIEIDPVIGFSKEFNKDINGDISVTYYDYPGVKNSNYPELNAYFNYYALNTHVAYSNDVYAVGKSGTYYNVGLNHVIPSRYFFHVEDVRLVASIGYSSLPKNQGLHSYQDYSVSLSKTINHFVCALQWTDTDGKSIDKPALTGNLLTFVIGRHF